MVKRLSLLIALAMCMVLLTGAGGTYKGPRGSYSVAGATYIFSTTATSRRPMVVHPNDFWYNATFTETASRGDGYSDGGCDDFARNPSHWAQWHMTDDYLNLSRAWAITTGDSTMAVGLVDVEFFADHYDLAANVWTNPGEIAGNDIDDDGNGLVDDVHGWDFVSNSPITAVDPAAGEDVARAVQHGTQMAALIAAVGNNESWASSSMVPDEDQRRQGSVGVAWRAQIVPAVYFPHSGNDAMDGTTLRSQRLTKSPAEYLCWAKDAGAADIQVASLSVSDVDEYSVSRLIDMGILPIVSAGNGRDSLATWVDYPIAIADSALMVGACAADYSVDFYPSVSELGSAHGAGVDICGYAGNPGGSVYSWAEEGFRILTPGYLGKPFMMSLGYVVQGAAPTGLDWCSSLYQSDTAEPGTAVPCIMPTASWTSGAAAQVSGAALLIADALNIRDAPLVLRDRIIRGGANIDAYNTDTCGELGGYDCEGLLGAGRLDVYRAMTLWGSVKDTTLSGTVYISGDVNIEGMVTVADNTTFLVAPDDIYQNAIHPAADCRPGDYFDYADVTQPTNRLSPAGVCIYIMSGHGISFGSNVTFRSFTTTPGAADWEGFHTDGGMVFGAPSIFNAAN